MSCGRLSEEQYRAYGKEIVPKFLFLACRFEADDPAFLREHQISHILNVAEECEPFPAALRMCQVLHIPILESPRTDLRAHFREAFTFIEAARQTSGGRVLLHCFEGRNRSASFVLAYLMCLERISLAAAFSHVKGVRSLVDPNIGYMKQLRDLELVLLGDEVAVAPSMPLDQQACCDLLDMEIIVAKELGRYTDLPVLQYEEVAIDVVRPPPPLGDAAKLMCTKACGLVPTRGVNTSKGSTRSAVAKGAAPKRGTSGHSAGPSVGTRKLSSRGPSRGPAKPPEAPTAVGPL
ncbi:unnamed protein product [Polarella glacialis]|uniref:protein-tyrosine-phosphatase n=1 Tax=Polarella glacialis TaxID=89957 RepID=A0A813LNG5_POLGL|nr:unnamed protein product [Polarella glacialis]